MAGKQSGGYYRRITLARVYTQEVMFGGDESFDKRKEGGEGERGTGGKREERWKEDRKVRGREGG